MSIDPSLKSGNSLAGHRNVLTRAERIEKLLDQGRFDKEDDSPLGLPKVANRKVAVAKKPKKKGPEDEDAIE